MPTAETKVLSAPELRWCRTERLRLSGEAAAANREVYWEIFDYNQRVKRYRNLCTNKQADPRDVSAVKAELNEVAIEGMREAGARQAVYARIARQDRLMHVAMSTAAVFDRADQSRRRIAALDRWTDVYQLNGLNEDAVAIEWLEGDTELVRRTGWINTGDLAPGSGTEARTQYCRARKGPPLGTNELIRGIPSRERFMLLQVHNPASLDAYVTLTNALNGDVVSLVVPAGTTRVVNGLPESTYHAKFITGSEFSRGCESFVSLGIEGVLLEPIVFSKYNTEWAISLRGLSN